MIASRFCAAAALLGLLGASACGPHSSVTEAGTNVRTSYPQTPARAGKATLLPAPVSSGRLIGPQARAVVVAESSPPDADPDDPSGLIAAGAVGSSASSFAVASVGAFSLASGLFVVGPLMLPWAFEEADIAADQETITKAVVEYSFPRKLEARLIGKLEGTQASMSNAATEPYRIEFRILRYGIALEGVDSVPCFTFEGLLQAFDEAEIQYHEPILWSATRRSEDLPPVRCADLDAMADGDGALAEEILEEAAIILSAAAIRRLMGPAR